MLPVILLVLVVASECAKDVDCKGILPRDKRLIDLVEYNNGKVKSDILKLDDDTDDDNAHFIRKEDEREQNEVTAANFADSDTTLYRNVDNIRKNFEPNRLSNRNYPGALSYFPLYEDAANGIKAVDKLIGRKRRGKKRKPKKDKSNKGQKPREKPKHDHHDHEFSFTYTPGSSENENENDDYLLLSGLFNIYNFK